MNTYHYTRFLSENPPPPNFHASDEPVAIEVAQLISGSLVYRLYTGMIANEYDMDMTTEYLEMLHEAQDHFGLLFFVFMLCDATNTELPERFLEVAANPSLVKYLADAMLADWLDFHDDYEG